MNQLRAAKLISILLGLLISILLLSVHGFSGSRITYACSPEDPDIWWSEQPLLPEQELPEGLVVTTSGVGPITFRSDPVGYLITNQMTVPIYVLIDKAQKALVASDSFQANSVIPREQFENALVLERGESQLLIVGPYFQNYESGEPVNMYAEPYFIDLNTKADYRSGEPPAPQKANLAIAVEGKLAIVSIELAYVPNPTYNRTQYNDSVQECAKYAELEATAMAEIWATGTTMAEAEAERDSVGTRENLPIVATTPDTIGSDDPPDRVNTVALWLGRIFVLLLFVVIGLGVIWLPRSRRE